MSAPNSKEVDTSLTDDQTHGLGSHEIEDVGNAATSSSVPITSKEVARQIKSATDPLTKQLEKFSELIRELRRDAPKRSEEFRVSRDHEPIGLTEGVVDHSANQM